jgi:DNA-binding NarL/FixJ family response regulator
MEVVAEADRGDRAYTLFVEHEPNVVVMDLTMLGVGHSAHHRPTTGGAHPRFQHACGCNACRARH